MQEFRTAQPSSHEITFLKLIEPKAFKLNNGIPVYTIHSGSEDIIKLDLVFDAGFFHQKQPLLANLTNKCMQEGTRNFSAHQIANKVDYCGAHLRTMAGKDDARLSLYCLSKHFEELLPMISEVAFEPVFPEEEVATIIRKSRQEFLVNLEKVKFIAQLQFNKLIFGEDHPYSWTVTEDSYKQITVEKLRDFHKEFYTKRPFKIFVSGIFPSNIQEILDKYFGHQQIDGKANGSKIFKAQQSVKKNHFVQKEDALQYAIRIGKTLFNKKHPDFIKVQVLNTVLGGYFGSRLMTNIREDKGFTYGIGSSFTSLQHDGVFTISTEVGIDVKEQALEEIAMEIQKLRTELVPDEELKLVKNYILGSFLRSADGPFALSELLKSVVDYDLTFDYFEGFLETVKTITANEIKDLAVKYLDPATMVTLVVGK